MYIHDCACIEEDREVGEGDICLLALYRPMYIYMYIYIIYNI